MVMQFDAPPQWYRNFTRQIVRLSDTTWRHRGAGDKTWPWVSLTQYPGFSIEFPGDSSAIFTAPSEEELLLFILRWS